MFVVRGKSKGPVKGIYKFRLWWTETCEIGIEASSRKEAEAIMEREGSRGGIDLSETNTDGYRKGTTYLGLERKTETQE